MSTEHSPAEHDPMKHEYDVLNYNESTAYVYDAAGIYERGREESFTLYENDDFEGPISYACLNVEPVSTASNESAVGMSAVIRFKDADDGSTATRVHAIKNHLATTDRLDEHDIRISATHRDDAFFVSDNKNGVRMRLIVHDDGQLTVVNADNIPSIELVDRSGQNYGDLDQSLFICAPKAARVNSAQQIRGMTRIFMKTMDITSNYDCFDREPRVTMMFTINEPPAVPEHENQQRPADDFGIDEAANTDPRSHPTHQEVKPKQADNEFVVSQAKPSKQETFMDIIGLDNVKQTLRDVIDMQKYPEIIAKWGVERPQGIMLYGPHGVGKARLIRAFANELGAAVWSIQSSDISGMWVGSSEAKIKSLFTQAKQQSTPTVLFFDGFDSMFETQEHGGGSEAARRAVATMFKQETNDLATSYPLLTIAGSATSLDRLDPALISSDRFNIKLHIPLPDDQSRGQMLDHYIGDIAFTRMLSGIAGEAIVTTIDVPLLVRETEHMNSSDLKEIFRRVRQAKAMQEIRAHQETPISQDDILRVIRELRTEQ